MELNHLYETIKDGLSRQEFLCEHMNYAEKTERLEEVSRELEQPDIWNNPEEATKLGQERASLEKLVTSLDEIKTVLADSEEMLAFAEEEDDAETVEAVEHDIQGAMKTLETLEFQRMFRLGKYDFANVFTLGRRQRLQSRFIRSVCWRCRRH